MGARSQLSPWTCLFFWHGVASFPGRMVMPEGGGCCGRTQLRCPSPCGPGSLTPCPAPHPLLPRGRPPQPGSGRAGL